MKRLKYGLNWLLILLAFLIFGRKKVKPEEKIVSWDKVEAIFKSVFGSKAYLYIVDEKYYLPSIDEVREFVNWWCEFINSRGLKWTKDVFDCDNFSLLFSAMCSIKTKFHAPITNSLVHSYNCVLLNTEEVFLIEPQTGKIFSPDAVKKTSKRILFNFRNHIRKSGVPDTQVKMKVKEAIREAVSQNPKNLLEYLSLLFNELDKRNVGDKLSDVYNTRFLYYT